MKIVADVEGFSLKCGGFVERYNPKVFGKYHQGGWKTAPDTPENRSRILAIHMARHEIFDRMRALPSRPCNELRDLANEVEDLEYQLQEAWGFPADSNYHTYWYEVPHCACPLMDNDEEFGSSYRIKDKSCPVHG